MQRLAAPVPRPLVVREGPPEQSQAAKATCSTARTAAPGISTLALAGQAMAHFSRVFRAQLGMAPSDLRRQAIGAWARRPSGLRRRAGQHLLGLFGA